MSTIITVSKKKKKKNGTNQKRKIAKKKKKLNRCVRPVGVGDGVDAVGYEIKTTNKMIFLKQWTK